MRLVNTLALFRYAYTCNVKYTATLVRLLHRCVVRLPVVSLQQHSLFSPPTHRCAQAPLHLTCTMNANLHILHRSKPSRGDVLPCPHRLARVAQFVRGVTQGVRVGAGRVTHRQGLAVVEPHGRRADDVLAYETAFYDCILQSKLGEGDEGGYSWEC